MYVTSGLYLPPGVRGPAELYGGPHDGRSVIDRGVAFIRLPDPAEAAVVCVYQYRDGAYFFLQTEREGR